MALSNSGKGLEGDGQKLNVLDETHILYLYLWQKFRSLGQIHAPEPNGNGTGRDDDHSVAIVAELDCRLDNQGKDGENGLVGLLIDNRT